MLDFFLAQAKARRKAGHPREAIALCRQALAAGAPAADAHLQLGVLHAELAELDAAAQELTKSLALSPRSTDAMSMLGSVMNDLRRPDEAAALFQRAIELKPDLSDAHFNLGLARFEQSNLSGAAASFAQCASLIRGKPWDEARRADLSAEPSPRFAAEEMAVNRVKLVHDCEQLGHLLELGRLPARYREVLADYRGLLEEIREVPIDRLQGFDPVRHPLVARTYKRPLHIVDAPPPGGPLVNPRLDRAALEARYLGADPSCIVVDELLSAEAIAALRRFCFESTIWNNIKPGYLGAYFYDGFGCPLTLRLAAELREAFPRIFRAQPLQMMWGYKTEHGSPGIAVHADSAAVNVNFWITPDEANLDPAGGGLLLWPQDAPEEWGFSKYNNDPAFTLRWLQSAGHEPLRIPYRANRAVIFDSDLFHATDSPKFRDSFLNRRINITLLYGSRR